jgi:hypothetical protein
MIINNMLTYGLRLQINRALLQTLLTSSFGRDDAVTLAAVPCMALFALAAGLIELLGLRLLLQQEKVRAGGKLLCCQGLQDGATHASFLHACLPTNRR